MTVQALREMEHEVLDIRGTLDQGASDETLWKISQREGQLLITTEPISKRIKWSSFIRGFFI